MRCFGVVHLYVDQGNQVNSSVFFVTLILSLLYCHDANMKAISEDPNVINGSAAPYFKSKNSFL